jgi:hypothetical protein
MQRSFFLKIQQALLFGKEQPINRKGVSILSVIMACVLIMGKRHSGNKKYASILNHGL